LKKILFSIFFISQIFAQNIKLNAEFFQVDSNTYIKVNIDLDDGFHIYGFNNYGDSGPISTKVILSAEHESFEFISEPILKNVYDKGFERDVEWISGNSEFIFKCKTIPNIEIFDFKIRFQICTETYCLPPKVLTISAIKTEAFPISTQKKESDIYQKSSTDNLLSFIFLSIVMGFTALLTPCVFPMVPITISFFLKSNEEKQGKAVKSAIIYSLGIISSFTLLGFFVSIFFGAQGVQNLAANPFVNIFIALLFIVFSLSLFGLFEIRLPNNLLNRMNKAGLKPGYTGTFFAGIAFSLVSFTCTVAFVGLLLVDAANGQWIYPLLGMFFFSSAFSLPFFLLALFPQKISKLPKSGDWLERTKIIMAFLEIAAALKFISQADLVWDLELINRDMMLLIWGSISIFISFYLMDILKIHALSKTVMSFGRLMLSLLFFIFSIYLFTGLKGNNLQADLDSYLPPNDYATIQQSHSLQDSSNKERDWIENYQEALLLAKKEGKDLFVDFTGKTCTNCRWMEKNIFTKKEVQNQFNKFILTKLWTDFGDEKEYNQQLEQKLFGTVALPLYAIISPNGEVKRSFIGMTRNEETFINFLKGN
jgi:thiol:disulfide interchange protein